MVGRKRRSDLICSDDEDEDIFSGANDPKPKRRREDDVPEAAVDDVAAGPDGLIKALTKSGFFPRSGILPNLLTVHQTDFQQNLRDHFAADINIIRNVDSFIADCKTFFSKDENFIKALQSTESPDTSTESPATHLILPQDSLIRLLLNIEEVQPKLMDIVLDRLCKAAKEEKAAKGVNLPSLILSQMSWLNRVVNPTHLVDTLLDLLNAAPSTEIKRDIISQLPGLVTDQEQIRVAQNLANMIGEDPDLTAAILDALGDLNLPSYKAAEVRESVVKLLPEIHMETIPVLLSFVLKRINNDEAPTLIKHVRNNLDRAVKNARLHPSQKKTSPSDCIKLSVEELQNSLIRSKVLADTWLKAIQSTNQAQDHACCDLIVLVIQHKLTGRRRVVESLLKKKMRAEMFSADLIKETFRVYSFVLKDFFEQLRSMADSLLLSRDPLAVSCGAALYKEMFIHFDGYYQQEVVVALMHHVGSGGEMLSSDTSPASSSIAALQELAMNRWEDMVQLSNFIITILEYLDYMPLPQVKRVMELLARMAYGYTVQDQTKSRWANFSASIRGELSMIIKKQLHHTRVEFQRMGVVGCVSLVQCLADTELTGDVSQQLQLSGNENMSSLNLAMPDSGSSGNNLPTGEQRLKQARRLIDMTRSCSEKKPEVAALFMDEMANAVLIYELHPALQSYLYDLVAESFQEQFVVDESEKNFDALPIELSLQFGLDTNEDNPNVSLVYLNLSPMVIREHNAKNGAIGASKSVLNDSKSTVVTLMSHFRLLRNTISSLGDLDDIDALLGCSVCLPSSSCIDSFNELTLSQKDLVCRCLFYAINWFIEVINTFARTKSAAMKTKVLQRLRHIVQLKETLTRCLSRHVTFVPPPSVFSCQPVRSRATGTANAAAKGGKGKKGAGAKKGAAGKKGKLPAPTQATQKTFLTSTQNDEGNSSTLNFTLTGKEAEAEPAAAHAAVHQIQKQFREFDLVAFMLLSSPLDLTNGEPEDPACFQSKELELLLEDLSVKVEHRLISAGTKKRVFPGQNQTGTVETFNMLDLYPPQSVAKRCVSLIRRLCPHLEAISGYFQELMDGADGIVDGSAMFTELAQRLGQCYYLILRCLNVIISWHEFQKSEHQAMLEDAFKTLASRVQSADLTGPVTLEQLGKGAFEYIDKFAGSIPYFPPAVEHIQLLKSILRHVPDDQLRSRLGDIAKGYLKRSWNGADGSSEKGSKFNQGVETVLEAYLLNTKDVFKRLDNVVAAALNEVIEDGDRDGDTTRAFPTCNSQTFYVYYRAVFSGLIEATKEIASPTEEGGASPNAEEKLKRWAKSINLLGELVLAVKSINKRTVLSTCLKQGRQYVEVFLKSAMPLLDKQFKHHQNSCQNLLKNLQTSTRTLQHVCTHVKTARDAALAGYIPAMKKTLESLLYRVKAMLAANGCAEAFWLGNLKNRNLQGDEIHSQSSVQSDDYSRAPSPSSSSSSSSGEETEGGSDDEVTVMNSNSNNQDESEDEGSEREESVSPDF